MPALRRRRRGKGPKFGCKKWDHPIPKNRDPNQELYNHWLRFAQNVSEKIKNIPKMRKRKSVDTTHLRKIKVDSKIYISMVIFDCLSLIKGLMFLGNCGWMVIQGGPLSDVSRVLIPLVAVINYKHHQLPIYVRPFNKTGAHNSLHFFSDPRSTSLTAGSNNLGCSWTFQWYILDPTLDPTQEALVTKRKSHIFFKGWGISLYKTR